MNKDAYRRALETCATEPIHIIGGIQPPGVLLVYQRGSKKIMAASANAASLFETAGIDEVLGQPIQSFLDPVVLRMISESLANAEPGPSRLAGMVNIGALGALHHVSAHAACELVHVELEPCGDGQDPDESQAALALDSSPRESLLQSLAAQVQAVSGYSRVMVYRFLHDDTGEVVAEALDGDLPSYFGLRYPASDIPPQARALYLRNRVRAIADASHVPVPVHQHPDLAEPLDMSFDVLRTVSPVHLEYLRNMGVAASMSISLVVDGRLWGLVACHHHEPRPVSARTRQTLDLLGRHASMILDASALREAVEREEAMRAQRDTLESRLHRASDPIRALGRALPQALAAVPADGIVVHVEGATHAHGSVPDSGGIDAALRWARTRGRSGVSHTHRSDDWSLTPHAEACGLLAVPLGRGVDGWMLLFRREERLTVRWAGRPDQPFQINPSGDRVGPRTSFAEWQEQVQGGARPWTRRDIELAQRLRLVFERAGADAGAGARARLARDPAAVLEIREQAARLRRLAELMGGAAPSQARLKRVHGLLSQLERELGALAEAETEP